MNLFLTKLIFYDHSSRILQLSETKTIVFENETKTINNLEATDRSKISSNYHRIFFDVSLWFFTNTPLRSKKYYKINQKFLTKKIIFCSKLGQIFLFRLAHFPNLCFLFPGQNSSILMVQKPPIAICGMWAALAYKILGPICFCFGVY